MYTKDMTWAQWTQLAEYRSNSLKQVIDEGYKMYEKFYALTYGLSDETILALPVFGGKVQADLDNLRSCCNQKKQLYDAYYGVAALSAFNYHSYDIPFQG